MNIGELPLPGTMRWTKKHKAAVVAGVRTGRITIGQARERYMLSYEEFLSWQELIGSPSS